MAKISSVIKFSGKVSEIVVDSSVVEKFGEEAIANLVNESTQTKFIVKTSCVRADIGYRFRIMFAKDLISSLSRNENPAHNILEFREKPSDGDVVKMVDLLHSLGYTKTGQEWKPPLGENPFELEEKIFNIIDKHTAGYNRQMKEASKEILKLFKK